MVGRTLSHYRILESIGRGGMGEVYAAEDTKLGRKVALKILPAELAASESYRHRFEREARSVAALSHPNIVTVHSVEEADGIHFITMELVRGKNLAELTPKSGFSLRRFFELAIPMADAMAAAHEAGITHRDLKPGNVMVTDDGRIKVLDFGLAKPQAPLGVEGPASEQPTEPKTSEGVMLGTAGYMAPEQVRQEQVGPRADIFALGIVFYEMLTGVALFRRDTSAETLTAILNDDPPPLPSHVPPAVDRIVHRCLEKRPHDRFHSAHDLSLALEAVSNDAAPISHTDAARAPSGWSRRQVLAGGAAALGIFGAGLGVGSLIWRRVDVAAAPSFHRLTFRRGMIRTARFGPDDQTILYGALWGGDVCRVYTVRPESPESAPLSLPPAAPLAVSPSGELALALGTHLRGIMTYGTLARVPMAGEAPRELLEDVKYADWSPNGDLAVIRRVADREQLEFPIGNIVNEPATPGGGFSFVRVSPDGERVAFFELTSADGLTGTVATVDRKGTKTIHSPRYFNVFGLAWNGDEIWFTAAEDRPLFRNAIHAIRPGGSPRVVARIPGNASLHDVSPGGQVLMARTDDRSGLAVLAPGETRERDLSWLDAPSLADISRDGSTILFTEGGVGGGPESSVYLRSTTGAPAVHLGDGRAVALSPDARWAIASSAVPGEAWSGLDLLPTGPGRPRRVAHPGFTYSDARWLPDGRRIIVRAREETGEPRLYVVHLDGGPPRAITPEGVSVGPSLAAYGGRLGRWALSPDGTRVAVVTDRKIHLYPLSDGPARAVPELTLRGRLLAWIESGLLVSENPNPQALHRIFRVDPATGRRELWKEIQPRDAAGIMNVGEFAVTPDGRSYGYGWHRALSDLYLVHGWS